MRCNACGHEVELLGGRALGFSETCEACRTDLHSCLNCVHHDPAAYNACRESSAESVSDRERANRCEYFRPGRHEGATDGVRRVLRDDVRSKLDALFKK